LILVLKRVGKKKTYNELEASASTHKGRGIALISSVRKDFMKWLFSDKSKSSFTERQSGGLDQKKLRDWGRGKETLPSAKTGSTTVKSQGRGGI